jgi:hypothetical protein
VSATKQGAAQCSVCKHRADAHWNEGVCQAVCKDSGWICGCVGVNAAADGDAKKGGEKRRRNRRKP